MLINFPQILVSIQTNIMKAAETAVDKDSEWLAPWSSPSHSQPPFFFCFFFCTAYFCLSSQESNGCNLISSSEKASSSKDTLSFVRDALRVREHLTPFNLLAHTVTCRRKLALAYLTYFGQLGALVQSRELIRELNSRLQNVLSEPFASSWQMRDIIRLDWPSGHNKGDEK